MQDDFAVLGDLGEGRFIVRMFVHGYCVDEEFTPDLPTYAPSEIVAAQLTKDVKARIEKITASEAADKGFATEEFKSDGNAIVLPEEGEL